LIIRDGWGISPHGEAAKEREGNATLLARTPYHQRLYATYSQARLSASGPDVGLPEGQMGNSEVGHLNLGAGRVVYQDFLRINNAIRGGQLGSAPALVEFFRRQRARRATVHFWGLLSDGGVHSHQEHLVALVKEAKAAGIGKVFIHAFMDGRDTSPAGGKTYLAETSARLREIGLGIIATMIGRYFAMDRDQRWERTRLAYDLLFSGKAEKEAFGEEPSSVIQSWYEAGKTDEFIPPTVFIREPRPLIASGDGILFFNFRSDRGRQLCRALSEDPWPHWDRGPRPEVDVVTMTEYDKNYAFPLIFPSQSMDQLLGQVVARAGLKQLRMAETEKYPHVTFFFNGQIEEPNPGEDREMVPSPKDVPTYDLKPQMSARELTEAALHRLDSGRYDLVVLNFANPDMVGHTGSLPAAIQAVETVDACLERLLEKILSLGGCALVTADHGNCEQMKQPDGSPHTAHTTNLVHLLYVGPDAAHAKVESGVLADVAPTLLYLLGLPQPVEMTGRSLVSFPE
jgi:2,3-bisphosphoglycerate-independent phosphoglycerate mutase